MRIRFAVMGLCLHLLTARTGLAQEQKPGALKEAIGTGILRGLYVATPTVHAFDAVSTLRVIELGGRESNPLLAPQTSNPAAFTATKVGLSAVEIYLAHLVSRRHKFGAIAALAGLHAVYGLAAAHNFRVAESLRNQASAGR